MKKIIRNSLAALLMLVPTTTALSQNNVERIQSGVPEHRFIRSNIFYNLPVSIKGFSFTEYYDKAHAFFGKTTLSYVLGQNPDSTQSLDLRVRAEYGIGYTQSLAGIGINIAGRDTVTGRKYFVSAHVLQGIRNDDQVIGAYASYTPTPELKLSCFGDLSLKNNKWIYGEFSVLGNVYDKLWLGYNMGLQPNNSALPALEHRVQARIEL